MKKTIYCFILFLFIFFSGNAQSFDWGHWVARNYSSQNPYYSSFTDEAGNSYIVGSYEDTLQLQTTILTGTVNSHKIFLIKYDIAGNIVWVKNIGFGNNFIGYFNKRSLAVDQNGDIYICGSFSGNITFDTVSYNSGSVNIYDYYLLKTDLNGNFVFSKHFYHGNNGQINIALDVSNNINVVGAYSFNIDLGDTSFSGNQGALFYAKYDPYGNFIFAKRILQPLTLGGFGCVDIKNDVSGNMVLLINYNGTCMLDTVTISSGFSNSNDVLITKFDTYGDLIWHRSMMPSNPFGGNYIFGMQATIDNDLNVHITGYFNGSMIFDGITITSNGMTDIIACKLDQNGNNIWFKKFGGVNIDLGTCIHANNQNEVFVGGIFNGASSIDTFNLVSSGGEEMFLARLDSLGNPLWVKQLGSTDHEVLRNITSDALNNIYLFGEFDSSCTFENISISSPYQVNYFVSKLSLITSINQVFAARNNFSIFPNPTSDFITIQYNLTSEKETTATVFNLYGQQLRISALNPPEGDLLTHHPGKREIKIDMRNFPAGIYFVKVSLPSGEGQGGAGQVKKVVKY